MSTTQASTDRSAGLFARSMRGVGAVGDVAALAGLMIVLALLAPKFGAFTEDGVANTLSDARKV
jgi:hypothetical protein